MIASTEPTTSPDVARGREAGEALTHVRTVLSRAVTARRALDEPLEWHRLPKPPPLVPGMVDAGAPPIDFDRPKGDDPEVDEMRAALDQAIGLLRRWAKTGKTVRWAKTGKTVRWVRPASREPQ